MGDMTTYKTGISALVASAVLAVAGISFTAPAVAQEGEQKEERKTTKTGSMSERVYKRLAEAQELAAPEDENAEPNIPAAIEKLKEIEVMKNLSNYEQAQLYNFYGFIYYSQEQYEKSIESYNKVLGLEEVPPGLISQVTYTLAQLKFTTEEYQEAIDLIKEWLKTQENPGPEPYVLIGTGYYQLGEIDNIIPPLEKAMDIARERGTEPKEQWWLLLRVAYWEKGDTKKVKEILEILVTNWPKKEYWTQLSAIYGELDQEPKQLSAFASAYDQGLLTSSSELVQIASLYLANDVPYKAAKIFEKGFKDELIEKKVQNLRLYSQAWALAREDARAVDPLKEAAKLSDDGELDARLAQSYSNLGQYKSCVTAARNAIKKGDLKRPDIVNFTLGQCLYELDDFANAKAAFRKAGKDERSATSASQWVLFIESEEDRIAKYEKALADLDAALGEA